MSYPPPPGPPHSPDPAGPQPGYWPDPQATNPSGGAEQPTAPAYPAPGYGPPAAPAPPGYGYPPYGYGHPPYGYGYPTPAAAPTKGLAIASLVCSLAGLAVGISAPVGAILGHVARRQIRERGEEGDGMALAGIIIGWILTGLILLCVVGYAAVFAWAVNQDPNSF